MLDGSREASTRFLEDRNRRMIGSDGPSLAIIRAGCPAKPGGDPALLRQGGAMALSLVSDKIRPGGEIPREHSGEGPDRSPPLRWSGVPDGAQSLALVVEDPD